MMETFKEEMKNSLKEIKEETNKNWKKLINPSKKSKKTKGGKTIKQVKETVQDLKTEIEVKKRTKGILYMENLGKWIGTTEKSKSNRIQEKEEKISGAENALVKIDSLVKENIKSNKFLTQNIQEIWDTMKKPSLRIIK